MRCHTGRDMRRRECLKRIRGLEIEANLNSTNSSHIESELSSSEHRVSGSSWNLDQVLTSRAPGEGRLSESLLHTAKDKVGGRWWEETLPDTTASLQGVASYLFQQAVVGSKKVAQTRLSIGRSGVKRKRQSNGLPRPEVLDTMRMVLDSSTHHKYFPTPLDPTLVHFVTAKQDAYIPRANIADVRSLWKGG